jgi:large subunit ribosomal protein L9
MAQVQLILREDVYRLGEAGDLVSVKPGYARNYLLPQGKAMLATADRVKELEHQKRVVADKLAKQLSDLQAVKSRLAGVKLEFSAQAGEEGKLFGSITSQQIAEQLGEKGFEVDRRKIALDEPIKNVGEHTVTIRLRRDVEAELSVTVTAAE